MSERPRLLDLFSGAGGAARGYQRAGFHVTGVDIRPQPRYAGDRHVQADALAYVAEHGHEYDAIHASPPCQEHTALRACTQRHYEDLIPPTRDALRAIGRPYVIENVPGAETLQPLLRLCGSMFGLTLIRRHRFFESNVLLWQLPCRHEVYANNRFSPNRSDRKKDPTKFARVLVIAGHDKQAVNGGVETWRSAMGIPWMTGEEIAQAIPPAYTEYIGAQLRRYLEAA